MYNCKGITIHIMLLCLTDQSWGGRIRTLVEWAKAIRPATRRHPNINIVQYTLSKGILIDGHPINVEWNIPFPFSGLLPEGLRFLNVYYILCYGVTANAFAAKSILPAAELVNGVTKFTN